MELTASSPSDATLILRYGSSNESLMSEVHNHPIVHQQQVNNNKMLFSKAGNCEVASSSLRIALVT